MPQTDEEDEDVSISPQIKCEASQHILSPNVSIAQPLMDEVSISTRIKYQASQHIIAGIVDFALATVLLGEHRYNSHDTNVFIGGLFMFGSVLSSLVAILLFAGLVNSSFKPIASKLYYMTVMADIAEIFCSTVLAFCLWSSSEAWIAVPIFMTITSVYSTYLGHELMVQW